MILIRAAVAATCAALAAAACSTATEPPVAVSHNPAVTSPAPAPSSPPAPSYSNAQACRAFRRATTKGVPASAAGENTLTWLQGNEGDADPVLVSALRRFVGAWSQVPPRPARISAATRAVKRICGY